MGIVGTAGPTLLLLGVLPAALAPQVLEPPDRSSLPLTVEVRTGASLGEFAPSASGLHWAPGFGAAAAVEWGLSPRVSVYAGVSRSPFGCDRGFCQGEEVSFVSLGMELGLRGELGVWSRPWLRLGAARHRLDVRWRGGEGALEEASESGFGLEAAAGLAVPIGGSLSLTPGVRFLRYTTPDPVRLLGANVGLRLRL